MGCCLNSIDSVVWNSISEANIERICEEASERRSPPGRFLLSSHSVSNSLLGVKVTHLEDGQLLAWPGVELAGATFDPDWGFSRVELKLGTDGQGEFQVPEAHFDTFMFGDTWGYRLCPVDEREISGVLRQLAQVRIELAKLRTRPTACDGIELSITEL